MTLVEVVNKAGLKFYRISVSLPQDGIRMTSGQICACLSLDTWTTV